MAVHFHWVDTTSKQFTLMLLFCTDIYCVISECPALTVPAPVAGSLSTTDHYEGITVTLTCNSGFTLVGDSSSTCNSGSWSATLGTCEQGKSNG